MTIEWQQKGTTQLSVNRLFMVPVPVPVPVLSLGRSGGATEQLSSMLVQLEPLTASSVSQSQCLPQILPRCIIAENSPGLLQGRGAPVRAASPGAAEPQRELSGAGQRPGGTLTSHAPRVPGPVLHQ